MTHDQATQKLPSRAPIAKANIATSSKGNRTRNSRNTATNGPGLAADNCGITGNTPEFDIPIDPLLLQHDRESLERRTQPVANTVGPSGSVEMPSNRSRRVSNATASATTTASNSPNATTSAATQDEDATMVVAALRTRVKELEGMSKHIIYID